LRRQESVLSNSAVQGYLLILLACATGLLFSIPAGGRVSQLIDVRWQPSPFVFHLTYLTLIALLGTFRGIAAARWERLRWETLPRLLWHILFGQLVVLPLLFFARALLPGHDLALPLLVLYSTLASFMFALISLRLALWGVARQTHTFMLQYALFGLVLLVPWSLGFVPHVPSAVTLLSPLGAALRIVQSAPSLELLVAYAFLVALVFAQILGLRRSLRRTHAV